MMWSVALAVVLGLALAGAVVALVVTEWRARPPKPAKPSAAVRGREALDIVDAGLRRLTAECLRRRRELPDLYAVVRSENRVDLLLAGAEPQAPAPWTAQEDGERWTVETAGLVRPGPEAQPALPYVLTVTVGFAGADRVLVDLSRSGGTLAVTGPDTEVRTWARAVVTEMITGPVGGLAQVTVVGSLATDETVGVATLPSARLHTAASLGEALARTPGGPEAPDEGDVTQIFRPIEGTNRLAVPGEAPHLFVVDATQLPRRGDALDALRPGDAVLVLGDAPAGWRWRADADGTLDTGPLGLGITLHAGRAG